MCKTYISSPSVSRIKLVEITTLISPTLAHASRLLIAKSKARDAPYPTSVKLDVEDSRRRTIVSA